MALDIVKLFFVFDVQLVFLDICICVVRIQHVLRTLFFCENMLLSFSADAVLGMNVGEVVVVANEGGSRRVAGRHRNHGVEDDVRYCPDCHMWLNGFTQWQDHRIGKKHRRNSRLALAYDIAAASGL